MKFKFRLEAVLRHRKTLEDLAQRDFREAEAIMFEQLRILREMRAKVVEAREIAFQTQINGQKPAATFGQIDQFLKLQDLRIETQQKKVQEVEKRVEELREILRQKAIDTKMVESLKERKRQEFRKEQGKRELKMIDDLSTMRHGRK